MMKFKLYKHLSIDDHNIHSIGIFSIISDDDRGGKYLAMYFDENMKSSLYDINKNDVIEEPTTLHFIFERYVTDNPNEAYDNPEDALFNVFKMLYKNNAYFKTRKEGSNKSMIIDKEFRNSIIFSRNIQPTFENAYDEILKFVNKEIGRMDEKIVIVIDYTDEGGMTQKSDVIIADTYIEVANFIALYDYADNTSVDVYAVLGNRYSAIKYKPYNSNCFRTHAGCKVNTYDIHQIARRIWENSTTVHY